MRRLDYDEAQMGCQCYDCRNRKRQVNVVQKYQPAPKYLNAQYMWERWNTDRGAKVNDGDMDRELRKALAPIADAVEKRDPELKLLKEARAMTNESIARARAEEERKAAARRRYYHMLRTIAAGGVGAASMFLLLNLGAALAFLCFFLLSWSGVLNVTNGKNNG